MRGQRHAPAALCPGKDPIPIIQEAGWAPGLVWTGAENLAPPGFDPRTVQPVASHYTDWATRPTFRIRIAIKYNIKYKTYFILYVSVYSKNRGCLTWKFISGLYQNLCELVEWDPRHSLQPLNSASESEKFCGSETNCSFNSVQLYHLVILFTEQRLLHATWPFFLVGI